LQVCNDLYDTFSNDENITKVGRLTNGGLDHQTANKYAKEGKIVVAIYKDPEGKNGHIAFVTGGKMDYSGEHKTNVVQINGMQNRIGEETNRSKPEIKTELFGWQFTPKTARNTDFFVINPAQITTIGAK